MKDRLLDRRTALKGAGLASVGALAALMPSQAWAIERPNEQDDPTGGWEVTGMIAGRPPFKVLVVLTKGGGVLRSGQNDLRPTSLASPSYGSWAKLEEEHQFGITVLNFRYSASGDLIGTTKIRVRATLNEAGDRFSGRSTTQLLDLNGNPTATLPGTVDAVRIKVELPE
jgi:hypothetical protein